MSTKTVVAFLFAALGGLLSLIGFWELSRNRQPKPSDAATSSVVVARTSIARGVKIKETHLELRPIPAALVHKSMVRTMEQAVGRSLMFAVSEGELLMESKLANTGSDSRGLASLIPTGYRAKSITAVSLADQVAGLLAVGDRVDVIMTRYAHGSASKTEGSTETLVQNAEILAIGQVTENEVRSGKPSVNDKVEAKATPVTLLVTPKEASMLSLGQGEGLLSLTLRNPEDQQILPTSQPNERGLIPASFQDNTLGFSSIDSMQNSENQMGIDDPMNGSERGFTMDELFTTLGDMTQLSKTKPTGLSAIRTIRGGRTGVVPVRSSGK
jgi:Flp pilus assembly protein CpaB